MRTSPAPAGRLWVKANGPMGKRTTHVRLYFRGWIGITRGRRILTHGHNSDKRFAEFIPVGRCSMKGSLMLTVPTRYAVFRSD